MPFRTSESQQANTSQTQSQQSKTLADLVATKTTNSVDSVILDEAVQMDKDINITNSPECMEIKTNGKRRRLSTNIDDIVDKSSDLSELVAEIEPVTTAATEHRKFTSTNYRCIYLTPFKPTTNDKDIINYAISKNRDISEIMECKKLLPDKCNMKKVTFVSFKLTVQKNFTTFTLITLFGRKVLQLRILICVHQSNSRHPMNFV